MAMGSSSRVVAQSNVMQGCGVTTVRERVAEVVDEDFAGGSSWCERRRFRCGVTSCVLDMFVLAEGLSS
jgi:hypothetical protein